MSSVEYRPAKSSIIVVDMQFISRLLYSSPGTISRTTMIVVIVASLLVLFALIVGGVAWRFWRKRRRAAQEAAAVAVEAQAQVNPKQIDIEDPDPKHCAGARSGNPEIIRNFVSSKQNEKNTNKTQQNSAEDKLEKGKAHKENAR